jgi:hypothetical protein
MSRENVALLRELESDWHREWDSGEVSVRPERWHPTWSSSAVNLKTAALERRAV